jgi:hypothetical protein
MVLLLHQENTILKETEAMTTTAPVKNANDVASLFFVQKLEEQKERVARWVEEVQEKAQEGKEAYSNLSLYETCQCGTIYTILSRKQGVWLYKLIHKFNRKVERVLTYEGKHIGTWEYREAVMGDNYERLVFTCDIDFIREHLPVDAEVLALVVSQIESEK